MTYDFNATLIRKVTMWKGRKDILGGKVLDSNVMCYDSVPMIDFGQSRGGNAALGRHGQKGKCSESESWPG